MPNRNQIIVISVLGLTALLIGYYKNPLNLSMGKRAEVQVPVPPTIVTNVTTNLSNNIVANVITNAAPSKPNPNPVKPNPNPVKPNPNPVKPKPNPVKTQPLTPRTLTLEEKQVVGTYERKVRGDAYRLVFLDNGIREYYRNDKKQNDDQKWYLVDNELHIEYPNNIAHVCRKNPDNSITYIATIIDGKRTDYPKEPQQTTYIKIK